ncbi:hypothetical protein IAT38_006855 [Cryptococcus sp. DSM 104549]
MSISGSISRKRVGSVSQRGNEALPPLDIQSIQMPPNPQNALALKTAALSSTRSLYQTCSILRKRLRCVEGFEPFLEQRDNALDVVSHMCHVFRLGSPLIHLYNLLTPAFVDPQSPLWADLPEVPKIEYEFPQFAQSPQGVRNWAKRPENGKKCQRYIANFCMAMKKRGEEGRWKGEQWAIHELWGKSTGDDAEAYDSTGLMKVLNTVEEILINLPESAMSPMSPQTPYTANSSVAMRNARQSYDLPFSMGGSNPDSVALAQMAATMNGGVHIHAPGGAGPSNPSPTAEELQRGLSKSTADDNAFKSVEELVMSEKSYVQELEILVRCAQEMLDAQLISTDTYHMMFSSLPKILDFHRKFLIKLETEYEPILEERGPHPWALGNWGLPFVTSEAEFDVYGPYCAHYLEAIKVVDAQMPVLINGQSLPANQRPCLDPQRELLAFMIKPIQRVTKYGLLLQAILHATAKLDYPYSDTLEEGHLAVKRIAANINEATDSRLKEATVRELISRVEDWKGHDVTRFGPLMLDDHFTVTKADQPRDYHVFLFEKMMLCCKEVVQERGKKSSQNSRMLRKDKTASKSGGMVQEPRKLALKGRIFVSNIKEATVLPGEPSDAPGAARLQIGWTIPQRSQDGGGYEDAEDSFIMIGKNEDQMKRWGEKVLELAVRERKLQEENLIAQKQQGRISASGERAYYQQSSFAPPTPASEYPPPLPYNNMPRLPNQAGIGAGPVYSQQYDDEDDDGMRSGRTTPSIGHAQHPYAAYNTVNPATGRRVQSQQSMAAAVQTEFRARAMTEDQNGPSMSMWRNQQAPPPLPRLTSAMSGMSMASESSFGGGTPGVRPGMGRQMSSARLHRADEREEESPLEQREAYSRYGPARGMVRAPSHGIPSVPHPHPPPLRSRSASSPNVYQGPVMTSGVPPPPLPHTASANGSWTTNSVASEETVHASSTSGSSVGGHIPHPYRTAHPVHHHAQQSQGGTAYFNKRISGNGGKRSSGDSNSTETTETSSQTSPATPWASGPDVRGPVRQDSGDSLGMSGSPGSLVLIKLQCGEESFSLGVSPDIDFATLNQKILKKIRLCSSAGRAASDQDKLNIRWLDEDGDEIGLYKDEDIETMFDERGDRGGPVHLVARWATDSGRATGREVY